MLLIDVVYLEMSGSVQVEVIVRLNTINNPGNAASAASAILSVCMQQRDSLCIAEHMLTSTK